MTDYPNRNGTAPPRWQTGETPPSPEVHFVFGSQALFKPSPTNTTSIVPKAPMVKRCVHSRVRLHLRCFLRCSVGSPTGHDCVICQDPIYGAEIRAPCNHYYDISCITDLFESATRDETLFPPRCCKQNIPFAQVQPHLSQTLIATFQEKKIEFSTLKRVYCSSPTCSRFLGPLSEGDFASKVYTCPGLECWRETCGKCRQEHNGDWGHVCRPDADATEVLELSRASGWSRCPGCSQMIELNVGCFHMTCRCRTEFCYLCRARWKTCPCPQWDESRLFSAAEERVDAQLGAGRERGARHDAAALRPHPAPAPAPAARNPFAILEHVEEPVQTIPQQWPELAPSAPTTRPVVRPPTASNSNGRHTTPTAAWPTRTWANTATFATSDEEYWPETPSTSDEDYLPEFTPDIINGMRERMIREMMERLRIDHDCDHTQWRFQDEDGFCDSCGDYLPLYLFVSGQRFESLWLELIDPRF